MAIADPPEEIDGTASDPYRPYYAVDVKLLKPDGTDDTDQPLLEAVQVPLHMAGDESGQFGFMKEGTLVVIAFAYGSPGHPFIQAILPEACLYQNANQASSSGNTVRVFIKKPIRMGTGIE